MRLVCPNCDAKYEVPEDAIPDAGRDVQCANCSHAWFQTRARTASAAIVTKQPDPEPVAGPLASPAAVADSEPAAAMPPVAVDVAAEAEMPPEPAASTGKSKAAGKGATPPAEPPLPEVEPPEAEPPHAEPIAAVSEPEGHAPVPMPETPETEPQVVSAEAEAAPGLGAWPEMAEDVDTAPAIAARAVDESVLTILREEAEREAKARRADGQALEDQPDLGVDAAPVARKKGAGKKSIPEPVEATKASARRDLLPDVEEINSTLRPSDLPEAEFVGDPEAVARDGRGAFRSGFLLVLSAAILGGAIYIASVWLANLIPALEGPLKSYVGLIDGVRLSLDSLMRSATRLISGEPG